jgi:hypothetical protein
MTGHTGHDSGFDHTRAHDIIDTYLIDPYIIDTHASALTALSTHSREATP